MASSTSTADPMDTIFAGVPLPSVLGAALKLVRQLQGQLSANAVPIYDEALLRLVRMAQLEVRVQVSHRLAPLEAGPVRTVSNLALDLDSAVAAPVLRRSILVSEGDLVTVSSTRGQIHLAALAERPDLPASVRKSIVARGSDAVRRRLTANTPTSDVTSIHQGAMREVEEPNRTSGMSTGESMRMRPAQDSVLSSPLGNGPASLNHPPSRIGSAAWASFAGAQLLAAVARVDISARARPLTPSIAAQWIASGALMDGLVAIARLSDVDPRALAEALMLTDRRSDLPLLAMRVANIPWTMVEAVARSLGSDAAHRRLAWAADLSRHREGYERLSVEVAQRALRALSARGRLRLVDGSEIGAG